MSDKTNNTAEIIHAGADAIDSTGGILNIFFGNGTNGNAGGSQTPPTNTPPPQEEKKPNWMLIGGVSAGILGLIALLYYLNKKQAGNGTAKAKK